MYNELDIALEAGKTNNVIQEMIENTWIGERVEKRPRTGELRQCLIS
jgi:hypothetical protein